jgi:hypothetical protein
MSKPAQSVAYICYGPNTGRISTQTSKMEVSRT